MRRMRFWLISILGAIATVIGEGILKKIFAVSLCGIFAFNSGLCHAYFLDSSRASAQDTTGISNSKTAALQIINNFRTQTNPSRWKLQRTEIADRLEELISDPNKVFQGNLNLCGPAAFVNVWLKIDPEAVARYATKLYDVGAGDVGTITVKPDDDLVNKNYRSIPELSTPPAEWMMLSSLRDQENNLWDYQGTPSEDISAVTSPGTVAKWLEATGSYETVSDEGNWSLTKGLEHAKKLNPSSEEDVIMLINAHVLTASAQAGNKKSIESIEEFITSSFPSHFIVLTSKVKEVGDKVSFEYWTWGEPSTQITVPANVFKANYYGAVIAKRKQSKKLAEPEKPAKKENLCTLESNKKRKECEHKEGKSYGDPHLATFDGLRYSFQTVGEFTLAKSNDGEFEVQARQAPVNSSLSLNSAVAMKVGSDRLALYSQDFPDTQTSTPIRVNGKPVVISGEKLVLPGSGAIAKNGDTYAVDFPTGEKVVISQATAGGNTYFNVSLFVYNQPGRYTGLLGNVNGNPNDDQQVRDGGNVLQSKSTYGDVKQVLSLVGLRVPGVLDGGEKLYFDQLYKEFGNSWRVKQEQSLFDYASGKNTKNYVDSSFPDKYLKLEMLSSEQVEKARKHCTEAKVDQDLMEGCIFDVGFSGFSEFARTTATINGYVETINKLSPGLNIPTPERAINSVIEKVKPKVCLPFVGCL
ncbi:VWD domain-containing protein [Mastigocladopsis repens]|uniref:VWD domain-containing protein n=1 Tax=Mastigocladopsis repens TaxID=221287 RepID=UPI0018DC54A4|nr:VWD domain-containing protein [Mastigocladopsis repens]